MARRIEIAPSVLPADFARLGEEVAALEAAGVDRIQWDVMDGQFVPNITFGPDVIRAARRHTTVPFEAHLMVLTPEVLFEEYVDAGCERLIVHAESVVHLHRTLDQVRSLDVRAAVAIVPVDAGRRDPLRARHRRHGPGHDREPRLRGAGATWRPWSRRSPRCGP